MPLGNDLPWRIHYQKLHHIWSIVKSAAPAVAAAEVAGPAVSGPAVAADAVAAAPAVAAAVVADAIAAAASFQEIPKLLL